jgi:sulfur carrier protein
MASCRFLVLRGGGFFFAFFSRGRAMEIEVRINGSDERLQECTIQALVIGKGLVAASLVVEYNGRIVKQADWQEVILGQGDVLELLNFVGGG